MTRRVVRLVGVVVATAATAAACSGTPGTRASDPPRKSPDTLAENDPRVVPTTSGHQAVIPVRVPEAVGSGIRVRPPVQNPCVIQLLLDNEVYFAELSAEILPERASDLRKFVEDATSLNADRRSCSWT